MKNYGNVIRISVILLQFECARPLYRPVKWQWSRTRVSSDANGFSHTWQCIVKIYHIISPKICYVDKIIFILYAKFLSSSVNYAMQSLLWRNLYIHNESSYESADAKLNTLWRWYLCNWTFRYPSLSSPGYIPSRRRLRTGYVPSWCCCRSSTTCRLRSIIKWHSRLVFRNLLRNWISSFAFELK